MTERSIESEIPENDPNDPDRLISAPFKNDIGEQNCFVIVIIHALHYTLPIQYYFETEDITDNENYNLLVELAAILEKYRQLTSRIYFSKIPKGTRFCNILNIRGELDYMFEDKKILKLGDMGEPSDVFYIFLNSIHCYYTKEGSLLNEQKEECKDLNCPSHISYYINLASQLECVKCNIKNDLLKFPPNNYMYDINISIIISQLENMQYFDEFYCKLFEFEKKNYSCRFDDIDGNIMCECDEQLIQKNIILIKANKYLCFTLSWDTLNPKIADICKVFFTIPQVFSNEEIFTIYDTNSIKNYLLFGLVCYANNHNICFFLNVDSKDDLNVYWILNNDMTNIKLKTYKDVLNYCIKNNYFPKMLFYQIKDRENSKYDLILQNFEDEDYLKIYNYSLKIDKENAISYSNEKNIVSRLRPKDTLTYKTNDEQLIKSVNDMRIKEEKKKKPTKIKIDEEGNPILVTESDELFTYENINKTIPPPRKLMEEDKSKYLLNENELKYEEDRETPILLKNEWFCPKCKNVNNISTFECSKCRNIDMNIFDLIEGESSKKVQDSFFVGKRKKNTKVTRRKMNSNNIENQYEKRCLNCGNIYYNKCNYCKSDKTFLKIRDENQMKLVNFVYNRSFNVNKKKSNDIKKNINEQRRWKCTFCNTINENIDYCKVCNKNKILI